MLKQGSSLNRGGEDLVGITDTQFKVYLMEHTEIRIEAERQIEKINNGLKL